MTQAELFKELKSLGFPVANTEFKITDQKVAPSLPYIVYQHTYNSDYMADNQNYVDIKNYQIELYTRQQEPATEKLVEDKLKELRLPYFKTGMRVDSEKLWMVVYEIQLNGG